MTGPARRAGAPAPVVGLALVALTLAACSSAPSTNAAARTTTTVRPAPTTVPSGSSTTSTSAHSSTTSTAASATTCLASQLTVAAQQGNGAAGTIEVPITMTSTASAPCTLGGYPGMQLLGSSGAPIPTVVVRGGVTFGTSAANNAPVKVTLAHGQAVEFIVHYEDVPVGNETSCPTSSQARITPPNDYSYATIPLTIQPCNGGTLHVSPVFPPTS